MKKIIFSVAVLLLSFCSVAISMAAGDSVKEAKALAGRLFPGKADHFVFEERAPNQGKDSMSWNQRMGKSIFGGILPIPWQWV